MKALRGDLNERSFRFPVRSIGFGLVLALLAGNEFQARGANWYDADWNYRRKIAVAGDLAASSLTNFPLLVQIDDPGDAVFAHAQADGDDLLFTAEDGTTLLDHEIEFYTNAPTPRLTAWVRIPVLSNGCSTVICLYYGNGGAVSAANPTDVWDEHFRMVQHLEEDGTGTRTDSTTNGFHSTAVNNFDGDESVLGLIGRAHDFDGTNECLTFNHPTMVAGLTNVTVEAWFEDVPMGAHAAVGAYAAGIRDWTSENRLYLTFRTVNDNVAHAPFTYNDPWIHVALTYDGAQVRFYVKGRLVNTQAATGDLYNDDTYWQIGAILDSQFFNGKVDEVRISGTTRSADWIRASYDNQYTPGLHMTIGPEHGRLPSDRWHYLQALTVSGSLSDAPLTNFPLFVQITNAENAVFAQALPDGSDIHFTLSGSETRLDHELEYYAAGATPRLDAWVRIPLLASDADTELNMVYGNPSAAAQQNAGGVWDAHFKMVQHLKETGEGVRYDSTLNNVDSTANALSGDEVFLGPLGRALLLDGTTSDIITVDNEVLDIPGSITIEAWMQPNILVASGSVLGQYYGGNKLARHGEGRHWYSFGVNGNSLSYVKPGADPAAWAHMAITYDGSRRRCFSNGSEVYTNAISGVRDHYTYPWQIGGDGHNGLPFQGHLDEIRISDIARSDAWMKATFNNQRSPADYLTFGSPKKVIPDGMLILVR